MASVLDYGSNGPEFVPSVAGEIVLCSWARHLTVTVPLSIGHCLGKEPGKNIDWT